VNCEIAPAGRRSWSSPDTRDILASLFPSRVSLTRSLVATERSVRFEIRPPAGGKWKQRRGSPDEEVVQQVARVGDVDGGVPVRVRGGQAVEGGTAEEEPVENEYSVGDIDTTIVVAVAAEKSADARRWKVDGQIIEPGKSIAVTAECDTPDIRRCNTNRFRHSWR